MITPLSGTVQKAGIYHLDVHFDNKVLVHIRFA